MFDNLSDVYNKELIIYVTLSYLNIIIAYNGVHFSVYILNVVII